MFHAGHIFLDNLHGYRWSIFVSFLAAIFRYIQSFDNLTEGLHSLQGVLDKRVFLAENIQKISHHFLFVGYLLIRLIFVSMLADPHFYFV